MQNQINQSAQSHSEQQAKAQYDSIVEFISALDVDYDKLESLKCDVEYCVDAVNDVIETGQSIAYEMQALYAAIEAYNEMQDEAGEFESYDEAYEAALDNALDVQVRSPWCDVGAEMAAGEFYILLCTGGPAVRIRGELNSGTVTRAWLEHQDWGTPWTQYYGASCDTLTQYAQMFLPG